MAQLQHQPKAPTLGKSFCGSIAFNLRFAPSWAKQLWNFEIFLSEEKPVQSYFQRSNPSQNRYKTGSVA
jgi:hypothetical protein